MADDPSFFHASQSRSAYPVRPMSVTGFIFDPATSTFDFSAVPGFDLGRLQFIEHLKSRRILYARPVDPPLGLAAVDGAVVASAPTSGKVLKVKVDTTGMNANDEIVAAYDPPPAG